MAFLLPDGAISVVALNNGTSDVRMEVTLSGLHASPRALSAVTSTESALWRGGPGVAMTGQGERRAPGSEHHDALQQIGMLRARAVPRGALAGDTCSTAEIGAGARQRMRPWIASGGGSNASGGFERDHLFRVTKMVSVTK